MTSTCAAEMLRLLMSDLSESCWCAGWIGGAEYALWGMVLGDDRAWGRDTVDLYDVLVLGALARRAGGWWRFDDDLGDEVFVPMADWLTRFAEQER